MDKSGQVTVLWTEEKKDKVLKMLIDWFNEVESYNGECVMQCDTSIIKAPEVLADIADYLFKDIDIDCE